MKKIAIALVAIATLVAVGCSGIGPTGGAADLVGTWTNVTVAYTDLSTTPAASNKEGTWNSTTITYPTLPDDDTVAGVRTITWGLNDTQTTTNTTVLVINASGSYVKTTTAAVVWAARAAAPADTATLVYVNGTAITAGSQTTTTTETVTVVVDGTSYRETKVIKVDTVFTGSTKAGVAYVAADNSSTTTSVADAYVTAFGSLSYNTATAGLAQTVFGTTVGVPTNKAQTETTTSTWTFNKDGTYTSTQVVVTDKPAIDAVAATANSAAVLATLAGTATSTTTTTGSYTNTKLSYDANLLMTNGYYEELQDLYFYAQTKTVSYVGTGSLISTTYPATAKTTDGMDLDTFNFDIFINGDALLVDYNQDGEGDAVFLMAED